MLAVAEGVAWGGRFGAPASCNSPLRPSHGGSSSSVPDANYPPPPTNCWPEGLGGGGGAGIGGGDSLGPLGGRGGGG